MCEYLTYDDDNGKMRLCHVCVDVWKEEERLRALFTTDRLVTSSANSTSQFEPYYAIPARLVDRTEGTDDVLQLA